MSRPPCWPRAFGPGKRVHPGRALRGEASFAPHDRKNPARMRAAECISGRRWHSWFLLIVTPDKLATVAKAIGRSDLLTDPRFSEPATLTANMAQLTAILDEVFGAQPMAHWYEVFNGVHVTFGVVRGPQEVITDPQLRLNEIIVPLKDAGGKLTSTISSPIQVHGVTKVPANAAHRQSESTTKRFFANSGFDATSIEGFPDNRSHRRWRRTMSDIITEHSGSILDIQLNRPTKKNAMTSSMYVILADALNKAAEDEQIRVVLWHGAGDSFSAGNDIEDFLRNPPGPGESPQARLMKALIAFDKPLVAAVRGAAIGGGTTMLTHCDFVYAGESAKFQVPFVNLGLVPEFGSSYSLPSRFGHIRAAELLLLGLPFDARRAADLGLVTRVVPDPELLATASETARKLAEKPILALRACKRLMKQSSREQIELAIRAENEEFASRVRSAEAKEAFSAFMEKRPPRFTTTKEPAAAQ